jgi:hypothetical protein
MSYSVVNEHFEFSTPLSADTHGLDGVWMWLHLNSDWVTFTKTYNRDSLNQNPFALNYKTLELSNTSINEFSREELEKCNWLLSSNKQNIMRYINGELGVEELLRDFIKLNN